MLCVDLRITSSALLNGTFSVSHLLDIITIIVIIIEYICLNEDGYQ
jgi:hypothetical protein